MYKIDNFNREPMLNSYVKNIVENMSVNDLKQNVTNILLKEKEFLSDDALEQEIMRHFPYILIQNYIFENSQRSSQYHPDKCPASTNSNKEYICNKIDHF